MVIFRVFLKAKSNIVTIDLPDDLNGKELEIIITPASQEKSTSRGKRCFKTFDKITLDTLKYKFDRDELHER